MQKKNHNKGITLYLKGQQILREKEDKIKNLQKQKKMKELKNCTFTPEIKKKTKTIFDINFDENRFTEKIEDRLIAFNKNKFDKFERQKQIKEELKYIDCTFKPRVNK